MTSRKKDPRYQPGTFEKGDVVKVAQTPADAVKLSFDGFKRVQETKAEAPDESTDSGKPDAGDTPGSAPKPGPKPPTGGAK